MNQNSPWLIRGVMIRVMVVLVFHLILLGLVVSGYHAIAVMITLLSVGLWAASVFWLDFPRRATVVHRLSHRTEVLLTFDDGPHPEQTPLLLDALQHHGVKAVFFVIGDQVKKHPELVRRMIDEGHLLGNHTMSHPVASFWIAGPARIFSEIFRCQDAIAAVANLRPPLFRAPVGHFAFFLKPVLRYFGMVCCAWSHRAFDGVDCDVARASARCLKSVKAGDILVMHESNPHIVALLDAVMVGLQQRGLSSFRDLQYDQIIVERSTLVKRADF